MSATASTPSSTKRRRAPRAGKPELAAMDTAADFLDVHPRTVRRMVHAGQLTGYRLGRLIKIDGLGKAIISRLVELSGDHKKVILYANPGTEGFYSKLGFHRVNTALAIWRDRERAIETGLISKM